MSICLLFFVRALLSTVIAAATAIASSISLNVHSLEILERSSAPHFPDSHMISAEKMTMWVTNHVFSVLEIEPDFQYIFS